MHPEMTAMLAAQDIERELKVLKSQAEAVSIPLEKVKARRQIMRRDFLTQRDKLEKIRHDRRASEKELTELDAKLTAARARQSAVRNPKEAQALEQEIERAEAASSKMEEAALDLMEREEALSEQVEKQKERVKRDLETTVDPEIERLTTLLEEKQEMANALREERVAAVNRMDEETRENYEWLVNKHGPASAVAEVTGGACSGCGAMLLQHQVVKVQNTDELHRCDHCYRFLVPEL